MVKEEIYTYDAELRSELGVFCGVDEAGRGPLAGPVCCAAVILDQDTRFEWLDDSKKVSKKRREQLFDQIKEQAVSWHVELIDNDTIDEINILEATMLGMKKCIEAIGCQAAVVDGNRVPECAAKCVSIIKGDARSASVAAASILAKVTRDRFMESAAEVYPMYGFEKHKGYPTKAHYEAIRKYGITDLHRKSFLKRIH